MRRCIAFLMVMLLSIGAAAAGEDRRGVDLSYARIVEMAEYMRELIAGDYLDIRQTPEADQALAQQWAAGITGNPRMVVQLDIEGQAEMVAAQAMFQWEPEMVRYEAISSAAVTIWQYMALSAAEEAGVTAASYEEILNVNGQIDAFRMYAEDGREGMAMYIVLYDQAAPIVLLVTGENGGVAIQGMFLPSPKLAKCENYGQVSLWLMLTGYGMTCREILPE